MILTIKLVHQNHFLEPTGDGRDPFNSVTCHIEVHYNNTQQINSLGIDGIRTQSQKNHKHKYMKIE